MTLRVLHVLDHSVPLQSGYAFRTVSILREQRGLGWETFHVTGPKQGAGPALEEQVDGWHFFRTPCAARGATGLPIVLELRQMAATTRRLAEVAARVRPDVLHAHSPVLNAFPALRVGRRLGIPVVYEVRAFWEDAAVDHGTHREWGLRYRVIRALETVALRRADHVTTICEGLRRDIVGRGIDARKVTVIPNAVDVDAFRLGGAPDPALQAQLGLDGKVVVGFIGSFYAYEGLDLLLDALPGMLAGEPRTRALLVGGGPHEGALRRQAEALGIADKVIFVGRMPHAAIARYYDLIDVLVYPRHSQRLTELVTPLKPLEAMAQGRLLVASDVGGHRELIDDGRTGVLFRAESADALAGAVTGLLRDRARGASLRAQGRRFVETERSWAASVARYRPVFTALAASRTAG
jgi:PEP-CTERM/exosortase A-associated glycosyltransferase